MGRCRYPRHRPLRQTGAMRVKSRIARKLTVGVEEAWALCTPILEACGCYAARVERVVQEVLQKEGRGG